MKRVAFITGENERTNSIAGIPSITTECGIGKKENNSDVPFVGQPNSPENPNQMSNEVYVTCCKRLTVFM